MTGDRRVERRVLCSACNQDGAYTGTWCTACDGYGSKLIMVPAPEPEADVEEADK